MISSVVAACCKVMLLILVVSAMSIVTYVAIQGIEPRAMINGEDSGSVKDLEQSLLIFRTRIESQRFGWSSKVQTLADTALKSVKEAVKTAKEYQRFINTVGHLEYSSIGLLSCTLLFLIVSLVIQCVTGTDYAKKGQGYDLILLGIGMLMALITFILLFYVVATTCPLFLRFNDDTWWAASEVVREKSIFEKALADEKKSKHLFSSYYHRSGVAHEYKVVSDRKGITRITKEECKGTFDINALLIAGGITVGIFVAFFVTILCVVFVPPPLQPQDNNNSSNDDPQIQAQSGIAPEEGYYYDEPPPRYDTLSHHLHEDPSEHYHDEQYKTAN